MLNLQTTLLLGEILHRLAFQKAGAKALELGHGKMGSQTLPSKSSAHLSRRPKLKVFLRQSFSHLHLLCSIKNYTIRNGSSSVALMQIVMMEKFVWTTTGNLTKMEVDMSAGKPVTSPGLQLCALMAKKSSTLSMQITMALMEATVSHGPVQQN